LVFVPIYSHAQEVSCQASDQACLFTELESLTGKIGESRWKDQTYRELTKLLASVKKTEDAIKVIDKINHADTKAMTIRGIGMAAAKTDLSKKEFQDLFHNLKLKAESIEHPQSYAIALTYIAMSQAFAGDDDGAMVTAKSMDNEDLRNKAFGESAEIQAEHGRFDEAMKSIAQIENTSYRDKAHRTISKIFSDRQKYDEAYKSAKAIESSYPKAQAVLYLLSKQITPKEVSLIK